MMTRAATHVFLLIGASLTSALLISAILLLLPVAASAQTTPATAETTSSSLNTQQFTRDDTVRAIHNLFMSRRTGGVIMATSAIAGDLILAGIATASEDNQNSFLRLNFGAHAIMIGVIAAPLAAVGIRKRLYFTHAREKRVVDEYTTKQRLPYAVRRRLLPRFFERPSNK
ncbi:hypothetical protein ACW9KT_18140 [Hymenobacter sp. HD11105]